MSVDKDLRRAAKLAAKGDRAGAAKIYRDVLATFPANAQARKALAALAGPAPAAGRPVAGFRPPAPPPGLTPPPQQIAALTQALQRGRAAQVLAEGQRLALLFPTAPALLNLVAMALSQLGKLEASLGWSDRVIAADPRFAGAHVNKAAALARLGRYAEVETEARAARKLDPSLAQAHLLLGYALVNTDRAKAALPAFREAVRLGPAEVTTHIGLGNALAVLGQNREALAAFEAARMIEPGNPDVLNNIGNALAALDRTGEAIDLLEAAVAQNPRNSTLRTNYANALRDSNRVQEAVDQCEILLRESPDSASVWRLSGSLWRELGQKGPAIEALERAEALDPGDLGALALLWQLKTLTPDDPDYARIVAISEAPETSGKHKVGLELALFKAHDALDQTDQAFAHVARANALRRAAQPYSIAKQKALFEALKRAFPAPLPPPPAVTGIAPPFRPLFIVGMPRSGTSLVEQILASHSQVHGGGELGAVDRALQDFGWNSGQIGEAFSDALFAHLRQQYFDRVGRLGQGKPVITDKTPLDFRWVGPILTAMPEARVLIMRRDPRAVCWSNYSNSFMGRANNFGNDMVDTAEMYRLHLDLMAHWMRLYPGQIAEVPYERLTENQEEESRKLLAFAGLDWEPACLAFHETARAVRTVSAGQVRQKMYTGSSEAWRRYERHLGPMLDALEGTY